MFKKINIPVRALLLALVAAFAMRPVVVCATNGSIQSSGQQQSHSFSVDSQYLSASHVTLQTIAKEAPEFTALTPCVSREKFSSPPETLSNLVLASGSSSPKTYLVLRI
jgi:hypothetical protein